MPLFMFLLIITIPLSLSAFVTVKLLDSNYCLMFYFIFIYFFVLCCLINLVIYTAASILILSQRVSCNLLIAFSACKIIV